jgi:hypothetical protein
MLTRLTKLALIALAGVALMVGLAPNGNALVRHATWTYTLSWGGPPYLMVDEYGSLEGVHRVAAINGFVTGIGIAPVGTLIGVDPNLAATPGVTWASCTLYVNDVPVVSDSAVRGDGTDVSCLWVVK